MGQAVPMSVGANFHDHTPLAKDMPDHPNDRGEDESRLDAKPEVWHIFGAPIKKRLRGFCAAVRPKM